MLLDELGDRIATQGFASSSGADGWLLIQSFLPDSTSLQDRIVAIIETPGGPPLATVELDEPGVQLHVRGQSIFSASTAYEEAAAKANDIYQDLHGLGGVTLSGRYFPGIWAEQAPFLLEYDESNRPHIVCNFRVLRSRTT